MAFFPRYIEQEFAPARDLFRLFDDYANHVQSRGSCQKVSSARSLRSFQPRFDVQETKEAYELQGELPGIEQQNIQIEFTDAQTLTIKGRAEHVREQGARSSGLIDDTKTLQEPTDVDSDAGSTGSYQKPSVEDEEISDSQPAKAVDSSPAQAAEPPKTETSPRRWLSERSVGEFARTFSFPSRVDQDAVKASLKDGILSIVVPKAQAPVYKRISIE